MAEEKMMREAGERPEIPEAFRQLMEATFGPDEGKRLVEGLEGEPSVSLRVNSAKMRRNGVGEAEWDKLYPGMSPIEWAPGGFRLAERPRFTSNPLLHAGAFYVQEGASMWLSSLVAPYLPERPLRALDLCAAPGGKSVSLLEVLPAGSLLVSNEVMPQRAAVLKENMIKWGYPNRIVTSGQASEFGKMEGTFDLIVVDAPCSGEGMMRKDDTARSQWTPGLVESCVRLQREILGEVLPALRPGGLLVYSTCTFNRSEDEENVGWLVREHGLEILHPGRRFLPHRDGTEGLFMALLRVPGDADARPVPLRRTGGSEGRKKGKKGGAGNGEGLLKEGAGWIETDLRAMPSAPSDTHGSRDLGSASARSATRGSAREILLRDGKLYASTAEIEGFLGTLPQKIKVLDFGVEIGELKGRDLVPSHALAMSPILRREAFPSVELGEEEALDFLTRTALNLPSDTPRGFILLTYRGFPLGWAKNVGNRANILYPKEWCVRVR